MLYVIIWGFGIINTKFGRMLDKNALKDIIHSVLESRQVGVQM